MVHDSYENIRHLRQVDAEVDRIVTELEAGRAALVGQPLPGVMHHPGALPRMIRAIGQRATAVR